MRRALAISALVLLGAASARAFEYKGVTFYFTTETIYQYNKLSDVQDEYFNSTSLFVKYGQWSGGLTFRGFNYYKQDPNNALRHGEMELYRKYVQFDSEHVDVTCGDFYAMLGRGATLSVLQNDKAFRERTLFGVDVQVQTKHLRFRGLAGRVKDELQSQAWKVYGGEAVVNLAKDHRVGLHVSRIEDDEPFMFMGPRNTGTVSAEGGNILGMFSYYVEAGKMEFDNVFMDDGTGVYGSVGFNRKNVSVTFELKRYKSFDNGLNNPPSADRPDEAAYMIDSESRMLHCQYAFFSPDVVLQFNIGRLKEFGISGHEIYGGVTAEDLWEKMNVSAVYGVKRLSYPVRRWDASYLYRFTDRLSAEFTFRDKRYTVYTYPFGETDCAWQLSFSPYGSAFFNYQHSVQPVMDRNHFYSGGFRVNLREGAYAEAMAGTVRGGEVCSSGQCFYMPPFKGLKLSLYVTLR